MKKLIPFLLALTVLPGSLFAVGKERMVNTALTPFASDLLGRLKGVKIMGTSKNSAISLQF